MNRLTVHSAVTEHSKNPGLHIDLLYKLHYFSFLRGNYNISCRILGAEEMKTISHFVWNNEALFSLGVLNSCFNLEKFKKRLSITELNRNAKLDYLTSLSFKTHLQGKVLTQLALLHIQVFLGLFYICHQQCPVHRLH